MRSPLEVEEIDFCTLVFCQFGREMVARVTSVEMAQTYLGNDYPCWAHFGVCYHGETWIDGWLRRYVSNQV
jgi:hypothetical protein